MKSREEYLPIEILLYVVSRRIDVDDCTVENVMSESLQTVKETDGIFDCIEKMQAAGVRRIPVVNEQGKAVGLISFGDLVALLSREFSILVQGTTPAEEFKKDMAA